VNQQGQAEVGYTSELVGWHRGRVASAVGSSGTVSVRAFIPFNSARLQAWHLEQPRAARHRHCPAVSVSLHSPSIHITVQSMRQPPR